jgi:hypothetical protein
MITIISTIALITLTATAAAAQPRGCFVRVYDRRT